MIMKEKQNNFEFIAVIGIIFLMVFLSISVLLVFFTSTEWKDIYTTLFSIVGSVVGGLLGGYITLIGVNQTIRGQREQESIKLIPQKLIALHLLMKKMDHFRDEFRKHAIRIGFLNVSRMNIEFPEAYGSLIDFQENQLSDLEYEFIEIVSQVDIEMYKEIKSLFAEFQDELSAVLFSKNMAKVVDTCFEMKDKDDEYFDSLLKKSMYLEIGD
ncbi:hypothetical protein ASG65_16725 [Bacillus sp. Leaf13]|nr:hypothetical protein ASG65_16725 [Bacillus sp. Leaf13]